MGCCLFALLLCGAPRVALLLWWFLDPVRISGTFHDWSTTIGSISAPQWVFPLIGLVLLPWATVAYVFMAPGGLSALEWVVLVIAVLADVGGHGGSGRAYRRRRASK